MREIIFRGFYPDKDGKEKVFVNGEWVKGFWVHGYYVLFDRKEHRIYTGEYFGEYTDDYYIVIPETVGQYTGLKGKNGKKIFEGDILKENVVNHNREIRIEGDIYHVMFLEGIFWLVKSYVGICLLRDKKEKIEIIGNIFENP